jgi:ADP-ribose pyrophosphatase YjhB (NUDIX family)
MSSEKVFCSNCGANTHHLKQCTEPITSCGIILYTFDVKKKKLMYLMICRKHTIGLVELTRGRYNINDSQYIHTLCKLLTPKEAKMCLEKDHTDLWKEVWRDKQLTSEYWKKEAKHAENKWNNCKEIMKTHILQTNFRYEYPEWGFPKGRRNYREKTIQTAMRELYEETHISADTYTILNMEPVIEEYISYDGKSYKNIYYLARLNSWVNLNVHDNIEISRIRLLTYDTCMNRIRAYEQYKKDLLDKVNKILINVHNIVPVNNNLQNK